MAAECLRAINERSPQYPLVYTGAASVPAHESSAPVTLGVVGLLGFTNIAGPQTVSAKDAESGYCVNFLNGFGIESALLHDMQT